MNNEILGNPGGAVNPAPGIGETRSETVKTGLETAINLNPDELEIKPPSDGYEHCNEVKLEELALPQNFATLAATVMVQPTVPIRKPDKQVWFSPYPDKAGWISSWTLELKADREYFVVHKSIAKEIGDDIVAKLLVLCQTRQSSFFLWPIKMPDSDYCLDTWNKSAWEIIQGCGNQWIRLKSDRETNVYRAVSPISVWSPPIWPDDPENILKQAFRNRIISSLDHPVVKKLRGII